MRDRDLLRSTITRIRTSGSQAHLVRDRTLGFVWRAGSLALPGAGLNDQAVRDLIDDGWLQSDGTAGTATLDCWPAWTGRPDPAAGPAT